MVFTFLKVACYSMPYYSFLITHNISSDQSPITVNRTNVTLYGVQPGETYTVEIQIASSDCAMKSDDKLFMFTSARLMVYINRNNSMMCASTPCASENEGIIII